MFVLSPFYSYMLLKSFSCYGFSVIVGNVLTMDLSLLCHTNKAICISNRTYVIKVQVNLVD